MTTAPPRSQRRSPAPRPPGDVGAVALARSIGRAAEPYAEEHDVAGTFVEEGYAAVRSSGFAKVSVPVEFGGGGADVWEMCRAHAVLARYCTNTALAITMHHHNVLTMAWRWRRGDNAVAPVLRRIVDERLILATSGAINPARMTVTAQPAEGGLRVSGRKRLVSGAPGADLLSTPARIADGDASGGWSVVGILVPFDADGVRVVDDWDALGMRGSGSNSVELNDVFVSQENVTYPRRIDDDDDLAGPELDDESPRVPGGPPPFLVAGLQIPGFHISLPMIAAVYLGAASKARDVAMHMVAGTARASTAAHLAGEMTCEIRTAWWILESVVREATDTALGTPRQAQNTLIAKRQVILSSIRVVEAAMEMAGAASYMRGSPLERALRDMRAGITHPLPPEHTLAFLGSGALQWAANNSFAD